MMWPSFLQKARKPWVLIPVLGVVVFAFGMFWFLHNYQKKAFEEIQGGSPTAWKYPLLAAQRYLQTSGKKVVDYRGISNLSTLPPPNGALYIHRLPRGLSTSISDNLFAWVKTGGHLLLSPNSGRSDTPDAGDILSRLGVEVLKEDTDCGCEPKSKTGSETTTPKGKIEDGAKKAATPKTKKSKDKEGYHRSDSIIEATIDGFPVNLKYFGASLLQDKNGSATFRINGSYRINYREEADKAREDNKAIKAQEGDWLLQYTVGSGKITVLSENTLFNNHRIGDYDHAFLLSWLLRGDQTVWFLSSSDAKSLPAILWDKMPLFWISLLILIVIILWRLQQQSGTLLQPRVEQQMSILTHIDASGMFSWRMNTASSIIAANRKSMLQRLAQRKLNPIQGMKNQHLSTTTLAARTNFTEKEVFDAFHLRIEGEQDVLQTSRALQKISRRLHSGELKQHDG